MEEEEERISTREMGRRVDENVEQVAELARARTAGSPGTDNQLNVYSYIYDAG